MISVLFERYETIFELLSKHEDMFIGKGVEAIHHVGYGLSRVRLRACFRIPAGPQCID